MRYLGGPEPASTSQQAHHHLPVQTRQAGLVMSSNIATTTNSLVSFRSDRTLTTPGHWRMGQGTRINQPVTQQEYQFPSGETLLSTTDTSSHISYANAAFIRTSGFSAEELLSEPHNLVRHPDMPVEAFADMWRSLRAGQSWTALVKNRRKNGDHYWVRANAAPMRRNGQLVGYLSVRTKPSRVEIDATQALYQRFREGRAGGLRFHCGLVVRTGLLSWTSALQLLPTAWRIRLPLLGLGALMVGVLVGVGVAGMALTGAATAMAIGLLLADLAIVLTPIES